MDQAINNRTKELNLADAIAVLLQTWNISYYRFIKSRNSEFDKEKHFSEIKTILMTHKQRIDHFRPRTLESFCKDDIVAIKSLFQAFEMVLGKTGTVKCLHLLAPRFFPLWDTNIARAYKLGKGDEADRYCSFMEKTKKQIESLGGEKEIEQVISRN